LASRVHQTFTSDNRQKQSPRGHGQKADLAQGLRSGQVRISAFRSAAAQILPEVIAEFCRRYPAIAVALAEYDD
jgi:DNA-binding transcriptional LysR family regulator